MGKRREAKEINTRTRDKEGKEKEKKKEKKKEKNLKKIKKREEKAPRRSHERGRRGRSSRSTSPCQQAPSPTTEFSLQVAQRSKAGRWNKDKRQRAQKEKSDERKKCQKKKKRRRSAAKEPEAAHWCNPSLRRAEMNRLRLPRDPIGGRGQGCQPRVSAPKRDSDAHHDRMKQCADTRTRGTGRTLSS